MTENVNHDLKVDYSRDELARQHFVSGMRTYVLNSLSSNMRTVYDNKVAPNFKKKKKPCAQDRAGNSQGVEKRDDLQILFVDAL